MQQVVPQPSTRTLGDQAAQTAQAQVPQTAAAQPAQIAPATSSAWTPQAAAFQACAAQTTTPRSREEIRRLFTRRSTPLQSTESQQPSTSNLPHTSHPPSRLQHYSGPAGPELVVPTTAPYHQQTSAPQADDSFTHSHQAAPWQHQGQLAPAQGNHAPGSFGQFAYSTDSHSNQRASGQSTHPSQQTGPQRNSVPSQGTSGGNSRCTDAKAAARTSVSSGPGPSMRAEVLMGPAATIEVNVRFHASIATALKGYVCPFANLCMTSCEYTHVCKLCTQLGVSMIILRA